MFGTVYMSARNRIGLDKVIYRDELEILGEPEFLDEPLSGDTAVNAEVRRYEDPRLDTLTSGAYILAKDIIASMSLDDMDENPEKEAWEQAIRFKERIAQNRGENPVFVSEEILELLGEGEKAAAHMRFPNDRFTYPVTLKPYERLLNQLEDMEVVPAEELVDGGSERLKENTEQLRETYLRDIKDQAISNNFIVPVYMNSKIPSRIPASSLKNPSSSLAADPGMDLENYTRDENELEEVNTFVPVNADLVESSEGCAVLLDVPVSDLSSLRAEYEDGTLAVYDEGEKIHESAVNEKMEDPVDSITEQEVRNGVYTIELE